MFTKLSLLLTMIPSMLLLLTVLCTVTSKLVLEDGYYWRDYNHTIPEDAIPCGLDNAESPIYFGQVLHEGKLIAGKIYSNGSDIYYHWYGVRNTDKNVKILCSPFPEKFEWIWTNPNEVFKMTGKVLINGGYEPAYVIHLGRLKVEDETTIGKVVCELDKCLGFYYVLYGRDIIYTGSFEILAYNYNNA